MRPLTVLPALIKGSNAYAIDICDALRQGVNIRSAFGGR
ncbi:MAG: hypothetical protein JWO28_365 [Hyphomicrobiales bacterium]|nr:hypothetical protein [Hyphomicrobiales bacterium]